MGRAGGEPLAGLEFEQLANPVVSIVVPAYDRFEMTAVCLRALASNTPSGLAEVVLVDDCSQDPRFERFATVPGLVYLRRPANNGFCEAVNSGVEAARAPLVFLLNNDSEVAPGWLEPLLDAMDVPGVGAVGSKLVYPDGRLQEAGSVIWSDAQGANIGRGGDPDAPEYNFRREVDYCSAAALLVRRDLFLEIGGFDLAYAPGYYEDTDLCFELWARGHRVLYEPRSAVVHFEGATFGTDENPKGGCQHTKSAQDFNRYRFAAKWTDELLLHHPTLRGGRVEGRRNGSASVVVVDWAVPSWDRDSGSLRMHWALRLLAEQGCQVTFIPANGERRAPYSDELCRLGIEVWAGPGASLERFVEERRGEVDLVMISRPDVAVEFFERLSAGFPRATFLYDTVDLHQVRGDRRRRLGAVGTDVPSTENRLHRTAQAERWAMARADLVATVTSAEAALVPLLAGPRRTVVLPTVHEVGGDDPPGFAARSGLLFIGSYDHPPNVDAVRTFAEGLLPSIRSELEVTTWLLGSHPPAEVRALASPSVVVPGYLEDVAPYFATARVFVAPLRYGAGMKGKIGQAMSLGLPVVTTSIGAEGMDLVHGEHVLVADEPGEFVDAVLQVHRDEELWAHLSRNGREVVAKRWSPEAMRERLEALLLDVVPHARAAAALPRRAPAPPRPHVGVPTSRWLGSMDDAALAALWTAPWADGRPPEPRHTGPAPDALAEPAPLADIEVSQPDRDIGAFVPLLRAQAALAPAPLRFESIAERTGALDAVGRIAFDVPEHPLVSIVICAYERFALTTRCLQSLAERTPEGLCEVVLADDGSTDPSVRAFDRVPGLRVLHLEHKGAGAARNAGAEHARGRLLFFLDSDAQVRSGWLGPLLSAMAQPGVGAAGGRSIGPDGLLQECGSLLANDGSGWNLGHGSVPFDPLFSHRREADYCGGGSLMVRTDLFREMGGFDEIFSPVWYEDTDLCFEVRARGLRVVVEPKCWIVNEGGVAFGTSPAGSSETAGLREAPAVNRARFRTKWAAELSLHRPPGPVPLFDGGRRTARPAVLVVDEALPEPDRDAAGARTDWILRLLADLGCHVTFVPLDRKRTMPYSSRLACAGVEVSAGAFAPTPESLLTSRPGAYDIVLFSAASSASPLVDAAAVSQPRAALVLDLAENPGRQSEPGTAGDFRRPDLVTTGLATSRWDLVATTSAAEADRVIGPGGQARCVVLPHVSRPAGDEPAAAGAADGVSELARGLDDLLGRCIPRYRPPPVGGWAHPGGRPPFAPTDESLTHDLALIRTPPAPRAVVFTCSICGACCEAAPSELSDDIISCLECASTVGLRALAAAVTTVLLGEPLPLSDLPFRPDVRVIGRPMSAGLCTELARKLTFTYMTPSAPDGGVDLSSFTGPEARGRHDLVIWTELGDEILSPASTTARLLRDLLRPAGHLLVDHRLEQGVLERTLHRAGFAQVRSFEQELPASGVVLDGSGGFRHPIVIATR